jgi:integrase/recombinase XerD
MKAVFHSPLSKELQGFLLFKRSLGVLYEKAEFRLLEFDRFLQEYAARHRRWRLADAMGAWLGRESRRKAASVAIEVSQLRQFCFYLRRLPGRPLTHEPLWPKLGTEGRFLPYVLSESDVKQLLKLGTQLKQPPFRAPLYRMLLLLLYCTSIRFGEALRLCMHDVDLQAGVLFVQVFKGRSRWVPFHRSLAREMDKYLKARQEFTGTMPKPGDRFLVGTNYESLSVSTAGRTLRNLFKKAGLKPPRGRIGPRPYDTRHAFAIHRLSRWYRQGVDLHARLPWLSAYMGHGDILGTETYLHATPELLELAGNRLRRRYLSPSVVEDIE